MANTQNLLPPPKIQFFDNNGVPLAGGFVTTYAADGVTLKSTYQDTQGLVLNTNPIVLDSAGRALIWGTGQFVFKVQDALSNLIYTEPSADPVNELQVSSAMLPVIQAPTVANAVALLGISQAPFPIGLGPLPYGGSAAPAQWVLCYGQALSRTTYSALFAVIGTAFGAGDGSTTFNVPDGRGRAIFGTDAMGGAAANRLTTASLGAGVNAVLGASGGDEHYQQHLHAITDPGHAHVVSTQPTSTPGVGIAGGAVGWSFSLATNTTTNTTGITINNAGTGTGNNVPPALVTNYIMYAGV